MDVGFLIDVLTDKRKIIIAICLFIAGAIIIPNASSDKTSFKRAEIPTNLKGIKRAQLQYYSSFNTFVYCELYPGAPDRTTRMWEKEQSGGFEVLGWASDGDVRGSYMVDIIRGGEDFIVTGISDIDGDGVYATYVATKSTNPMSPITDLDIY